MGLEAVAVESTSSGPGNFPAGFLMASCKNVGAASATVNGQLLQAGEAKSYPFVGKGYQQINYDASGTTLLIMLIT